MARKVNPLPDQKSEALTPKVKAAVAKAEQAYKNARNAQDWTHYTFTRSQLAQYVSVYADTDGVSILDGEGGSTHLPTKNITLPVGADNAQDIAAHEAEHIVSSRIENSRSLRTDAERLVLNCLCDGWMERKSFHAKPGLRRLYQENRIDHVMPFVLQETWLTQALKGIYLVSAGYDFPRSAFQPKARKVMDRFEKEGLCAATRAAKEEADLLPLVPKVLALFDEQPQERQKQPQPGQGESQSEENGEGEQSQGDGSSLPPVKDKDGNELKHTDDPDTCPACNEADRQERESEKKPRGGGAEYTPMGDQKGEEPEDGDGSAIDGDESDEEGEEEGDGTRDPIEYDVDQRRHESEAARKMGAEAQKSGAPGKVNGIDVAKGGPSVNRLMQNANRAKREMDRIDRQSKAAAKSDDIAPVQQAVSKPKAIGKDVDEAMPEGAKPFADFDKVGTGRNQFIDLTKVFSKGISGAVGYTGTHMTLDDRRDGRGNEWMENIDAQLRATSNFLARQLTVFLQSEGHDGNRDHERIGRLDAVRAFQMGGGRFDVYRNPPNPTPTRPLVVLTVDMSGSMGSITYDYQTGKYGPDPRVNSFHATTATLLMAHALQRLGVPFEVHGFGGSSRISMLKTFEQPLTKSAIAALGNIHKGSGGTPAAEGLAFAWVRALTRPEERKIVIQVTDGGVPQNTKNMVDAITKSGGIVIGIGIGVNSVTTTYPQSIVVKQAHELPSHFARLLKRLVLSGALSRKAA